MEGKGFRRCNDSYESDEILETPWQRSASSQSVELNDCRLCLGLYLKNEVFTTLNRDARHPAILNSRLLI